MERAYGNQSPAGDVNPVEAAGMAVQETSEGVAVGQEAAKGQQGDPEYEPSIV